MESFSLIQGTWFIDIFQVFLSKKQSLKLVPLFISIPVSHELCIRTASLVLSKKDSEAVGRNDHFIESPIPSTEPVLFWQVVANKVCGYHVNVLRTWWIRIFLLVGTWITTSWRNYPKEFLITIKSCTCCKYNYFFVCKTKLQGLGLLAEKYCVYPFLKYIHACSLNSVARCESILNQKVKTSLKCNSNCYWKRPC